MSSSRPIAIAPALSSPTNRGPTTFAAAPAGDNAILSTSPPQQLLDDPRYIAFSTVADVANCSIAVEEDRLLAIDYDSLPTYPIRPSYKDHATEKHIATHLVTFDPCKNDPFKPSSMPIYQTSTFQQESIERFGPYDYTRSGNPTRTACEQLVASIEGAHAAFAFSSGMAAITAATRLVSAGDHILCADDIYGGAFRLFSRILKEQGIKTHFADTTSVELLEEAIIRVQKEIKDRQEAFTAKGVSLDDIIGGRGELRIIYLESPSNPLMRISDIRKVSALAKKYNLMLCVDATMMSPYLLRPLSLGADVVIHSGTKFLAGHSDVMAGFVCCADDATSKRIAFVQNAEGTALAPFDTWLVLRGLKTLALRQDKQQASALQIAQFLSTHPLVTALFYAGLAGDNSNSSAAAVVAGTPTSPAASSSDESARQSSSSSSSAIVAKGISQKDYDTHFGQAKGGGSVLSFSTGSVALSRLLCDSCSIFKITVSFGSVSSLIEMPCVLSHASIPKEMRGLPDDLIRLSIGIEDVGDLIADLAEGFKKALTAFRKNGSSSTQ